MHLDFLTTGIGRGHRFYLEGVRKALLDIRPGLKAPCVVASEVSTASGKALWRLIHSMYRFGSRSGPVGAAYSSLRQRRAPNSSGSVERLLARALAPWLESSTHSIVVDHPLLASIVNEICPQRGLIYAHGEQVAPDEALTTAPDLTLTPTAQVRECFLRAGAQADTVHVTGACIESSLLAGAENAQEARMNRLTSGEALTVAFYSSGAEPPPHLKKVDRALHSLATVGGRGVVFGVRGGRMERIARAHSLRTRLVTGQIFEDIADEERRLSALFDEIDLVVMPAHERVNWPLALGLPAALLTPDFGSFAPLNRELIVGAGVAFPLVSEGEAAEFGSRTLALRESGELLEMNRIVQSEREGFSRSAEIILERFGE